MKGLALVLKGGALPAWYGPALVISGLIVAFSWLKQAKRPEPQGSP